jgi:predicted ATPase
VVSEDLQWADAASVQVMDEVLGLFSDQPLLVLALGRPEVEERFPGLWGERMVEYIRLAPLSRRAGQTLLRLRNPPVTAASEHFILERWEGNPMFLEEMAEAIAAGRAGVPEVVLAAVEARFDCLSPEVRRVLRGASLYGDKSFSADALVAVLGEASRREMGEWLENLVMRDLVQRQADGSEVSYRLRNKLVREAAYRMLTSADRVLGRRLARAWLQGAGRTLPDYLSAPSTHSGVGAATGG